MIEQVADRFRQAEAKDEEIKQFIKDVKRLTRRKFTSEETKRIVLESFSRIPPSGTCARGKASTSLPTTPNSRAS